MSKVILALALCSASVRAQTGGGLAKENLSGGLDWSHGRRLDGYVDDKCEGGGDVHRFDSRLDCCQGLDTYDLNTFCTGNCATSSGCIDLTGGNLGGVAELKGSGCVRIGDGVRFWVMEGPMDVEVYAPGSGNSGGIQNVEVHTGANDATIKVTGHIREHIRAYVPVDNLSVDITGTGSIRHDVNLGEGANNKCVIQPGGSVGTGIQAKGPNAEIDIKGDLGENIGVRAQNSRVHIHGSATLNNNFKIHVWATGGYPNGNGLTVVNNGPGAVTIKQLYGAASGVTCNGAAVTFSGNEFSCPNV
jgi:hypothetical protein